MKLNCLQTVDYWLEQGYLEDAFSLGLYPDNIFLHIYAPITLPDSSTGESVTTWEDVGLSFTELAEIYGNLYSGNYIANPIEREFYNNKIANKIKSVYTKNRYKYLKLIELMGYKYNPLFNVDGVELYGVFENNGVNDVKSTTKGEISTTNASGGGADIPTTNHYVNPYDSVTTDKLQSKDTTTGKTTSTTQYGKQPTSGDYEPYEQETTITHNSAKNISNGAEVNYNVNATDNPFGEALTGADRYHVEKKIRQGNIGVTKTQELIAAERENLKYNLFNVFYEDISEQILVGVYDY